MSRIEQQHSYSNKTAPVLPGRLSFAIIISYWRGAGSGAITQRLQLKKTRDSGADI